MIVSAIILVIAGILASIPPKPEMKVSFQNTSRESLEAQRRMLKESIADVERLRQSGEVTGDAYLARLKRLRADLAENETAFKAQGYSIKVETIQCPNCGGTLNMTTPHPQQFLLMQNTMPAPYCGYENVNNNGNGTNLPNGNCFIYYPNEWMTFQVGVTCGNRVGDTLENSRVRLWMQRQGQPSVPVIDFPLTLTVPGVDPGYGKFWFMNYNAHPRNNVWKTWCSELIISRQRIPDAL